MNRIFKDRNLIILSIVAISFYFLAGVLINPFIFWTSLPLYISYSYLKSSNTKKSINKSYGTFGFILLSLGFSYFYHFAWYFDWEGTKTSSSTSALIFIWFPIYAVILGYIGYLLGYILGYVRKIT